MFSIKDDTIGGFNAFLAEQSDEEGTATVSLYDFNSTVDRAYHGRAIEDAPPLDEETYVPGGQTALHDAIYRAIMETEGYVSGGESEDQPENVIIVVLTDGKENASETPQAQVRDLVTEHREEHGWEFLFIGANQDAALTASKMGMAKDRSLDMSHSGDGARAAYESTSDQISQVRNQGEMSGYTDADRERQRKADE